MATTAVDPITTEVIRNALNSAAEEMNATLFRSAYTWIIYELRDCSVALLDADHRVLGQSSGLPIFLGNLEVCTKLTEETYGRDAWEPGDVWVLNDSYLAGTHLNDVTVFSPIFHEGELIGFGASRAHWLDVGAKDPGSPMDSTDIWQEGIRMGPIKVADGRARAARHRRSARAQLPLLVPGARRPDGADRVRPHGRQAAARDRRTLRARDRARRARRDLRADRADRTRGGRGDPRRRLRGRGLHRQRRARRHAGQHPGEGDR